ncbi:MAG TPA: hypothetical protein VNY05_30595 [Candidatus Acidoferrales bacterium]|jgi:Tol biopolymer transport system component|nr:hypothetical protein [Candidatus Acidoferrales bacterium]
MHPEPNSARPSDERLESWKEIASYLKKGVRTVQRWEQTEGLPVRRLGQDRTGLVFAYKSEIDAWWREQSQQEQSQQEQSRQEQSRRVLPQLEPEDGVKPPKPGIRWRTAAILSFAAAIVAGALLWNGRATAPAAYQLVPITTDHGWEVQPSFSPDGRQIAYVWIPPGGHASIYTKAIGAESGARLSAGSEPETNPAWSPDGRYIAFVRSLKAKGGFGLMLIPALGGPESQIAELALRSILSWSADGKWLIARDGPEKYRSMVAISVATGARHALTKPYEFGYQGAALSSDLRRLVYAHSGPGSSDVYEQALGPGLAPEGEPRRLISRLWSYEMLINADTYQAIYIDGSWEEGLGLLRLRLSPGAKPEVIHRTADHYFDPAISHDGRRLAFAVIRSHREDTWRLSLSKPGAAPVPLLTSTHSDLNPQYSPDGRYIAFHSTRSGASDIWVASSDGTNPRRLTFTSARTTATPRWSPDGEWIAFESNESGQSEVYLVRSAGGAVRRMTENPATDAIPSWSRDGRTLYFCSDRTGRFEVWRMPVAGGKPTQVTFNGGFAAVESPDAKYLYYSQTRNFGPVMRMPLSGGTAEQAIPDIRGLFYAVTASGIYFQANHTIWFWDAAAGNIREIFYAGETYGHRHGRIARWPVAPLHTDPNGGRGSLHDRRSPLSTPFQ